MADTIPGETVVSTPSAPMGAADTHPVIAEHQTSGGRSEEFKAKAKEQASKLASDASTKARGAAEEGKAKAAQTVNSLAQSTRDAARQFEGTQAEALVGYATTAADSIDQFGRMLDEKSVDELLDDAREIVRRSPAIAIGAAAMVGFAISRFAKATERAFDGDDDAGDATAATATPSAKRRYDA
ncbi:MAG: hypothetical protein AAGD40_07845 [Pseudomonadota bacterium]